ncbi:MAG: hypothetical protein J6K81_02210 [Rikenellaceae bacterium]|nr:hypothetical protein [Rikenellaceae bacterium]
MTLIVLLVTLFAGCFVDGLVGLLGSRRRIGFGWSFFLSLIFTPVIGLIITLLSDPLPAGESRWGCLIPTLLSLLFVGLIFFLSIVVFGWVII